MTAFRGDVLAVLQETGDSQQALPVHWMRYFTGVRACLLCLL